MRGWFGWVALLGAACGDADGKDDPVGADDTDPVDTDVVDTDVDTDVVDTDVDTDIDTDVVDTDAGRTPAGVYTVQPELDVVMGGAAQDFGPYSRVHQIVPAVELPAGRMVISEIRLRRSAAGAQDTTTSLEVFELWLGTAAVTVLGTTFADNFLGDPQLGFSGPVSVAANTGDTLLFNDLILPIDPPFTYDPANGALLLDFRAPTPASNVLFDCRNDASMYLAISSTPGSPTEGPIASGCGYSFQMVVD